MFILFLGRSLHYWKVPFLMLVSMLSVSCSMTHNSYIEDMAGERIVWPMPPEQPRIEFVSEFSGPEDLGIREGFWSKLVKVFVGGEGGERLVRPTAVVMNSAEVLFVADPGSGGVHRFDTKRKKYTLIYLENKILMRSPVALAIGPDDRVYVSDSALNKVFVIDDNANFAKPFETEVGLDQPTGLAQSNGRLYVVNTRKHEVLSFDLDGKLLFRFAKRGDGEGEFNFPTMIWSDPATQRLWVNDSLNFRIQQFSEDGEFISTFGDLGNATGDLSRPKGVAVDREGHVYVMDALFHSMQIFNPEGKLLLYVGAQGRKPGQFWLPSGIFIDPGGHIFIADSFNSRVQIFKYIKGI